MQQCFRCELSDIVSGLSLSFEFCVGDIDSIRDAYKALCNIDIDGDGRIGVLDFIIFAARLKERHQEGMR